MLPRAAVSLLLLEYRLSQEQFQFQKLEIEFFFSFVPFIIILKFSFFLGFFQDCKKLFGLT